MFDKSKLNRVIKQGKQKKNLLSAEERLAYHLASVVPRVDNAIQRISICKKKLRYPLDSAIHPLNNWGLVTGFLLRLASFLSVEEALRDLKKMVYL